MRLGKGQEFGKVLVELRSAEESHPPNKQLATSPEPNVPDDASQPVRINACVGRNARQLPRTTEYIIPPSIRQNTLREC